MLATKDNIYAAMRAANSSSARNSTPSASTRSLSPKARSFVPKQETGSISPVSRQSLEEDKANITEKAETSTEISQESYFDPKAEEKPEDVNHITTPIETSPATSIKVQSTHAAIPSYDDLLAAMIAAVPKNYTTSVPKQSHASTSPPTPIKKDNDFKQATTPIEVSPPVTIKIEEIEQSTSPLEVSSSALVKETNDVEQSTTPIKTSTSTTPKLQSPHAEVPSYSALLAAMTAAIPRVQTPSSPLTKKKPTTRPATNTAVAERMIANATGIPIKKRDRPSHPVTSSDKAASPTSLPSSTRTGSPILAVGLGGSRWASPARQAKEQKKAIEEYWTLQLIGENARVREINENLSLTFEPTPGALPTREEWQKMKMQELTKKHKSCMEHFIQEQEKKASEFIDDQKLALEGFVKVQEGIMEEMYDVSRV